MSDNMGNKVGRVEERLGEVFDEFKFGEEEEKMTFRIRAERELAFGMQSGEFMQRNYECFRTVMVLNAAKARKGEREGFRAPVLADKIWCLAILYSEKYSELSRRLADRNIDRASGQGRVNREIFRKILPDYPIEMHSLEEKFTVWVLYNDLDLVISQLFESIMKTEHDLKLRIQFVTMVEHLENVTNVLKSKYTNRDLSKYESPIPSEHPYFVPTSNKTPLEISNIIFKLIPASIKIDLENKYSKSLSEYLCEEYSRFMTMAYFTNNSLTPSEEIDQVWHLHQCETALYRDFCKQVYNKFIPHLPTSGGSEEDSKFLAYYENTLEFYRFLFKQNPIRAFWPVPEARFAPEAYMAAG
jgi:hypothetical protein